MKKCTFILGLLITCLGVVHATSWQQIDEARARLHFAKTDAGYQGAVELVMEEGWHSYWQYPGASGFPPNFSFQHKQDIEFGAIHYPAPYFFDDGVGGFFGYKTTAGFLFSLTPQHLPVDFTLTLSVGICKTICIPLQFHFDVTLNEKQFTPLSADYIAQLEKQLPKPARAGLYASRAYLTPDRVALEFYIEGEYMRAPVIMPLITHPIGLDVQKRQARENYFAIQFPLLYGEEHIDAQSPLYIVIRDGARAVWQNIDIETK